MLVADRRRVAWHDMTAVAREWRGRGLATALKRGHDRLGDRRTASRCSRPATTRTTRRCARSMRGSATPEPDDDRPLRGPLVGGMMDR